MARRAVSFPVAILLLALLACADPIRVRARNPRANITPMVSPKTVVIGRIDAPEEKTCYKSAGLRDFCVEGLQGALHRGLSGVLENRMRLVRNGAEHKAEFKMVSFRHGFASASGPHVAPAVKLTMDWQFVVLGPDGKPLVSLAESTTGPEVIVNTDGSGPAFGALLTRILERIAAALAEANKERAAAPNVAQKACVPGATQECLGPGACRGAQACVQDGSGYAPCDCGQNASDGGSE